jgi:ATP-dependent exoDNAse (exonuclease V) alpha subunit
MTKHLSLRLAWHNDGWNGHICQNPKNNTYCVGAHSYPGSQIVDSRNLDFEMQHAGDSCSKCDEIVACSNSINAFGFDTIKNQSFPPYFFNRESTKCEFETPPATANTWAYEEMYKDAVRRDGDPNRYDSSKRLNAIQTLFRELSPDKSLIFYYANKSNPFSSNDSKVYVLVGVGRLKKTGDILYYGNLDEDTEKKYGGYVWQLPVTSHYPDEGFVIPYHKYMDNEKVLNNILYIPEQSNNFKHAAKHITDDDALIYVERLVNIVQYLIEIKDDTENWDERKKWLQSLLAELWTSRGAYPGMASLLDYLDCSELISYYYQQAKKDKSGNICKSIFDFFESKGKSRLIDCSVSDKTLETYCRNWYTKLKNGDLRKLAGLLARVAIGKKQFEHILSDSRAENGITATVSEIVDNLYSISEQYAGDDAGDEIPLTKIDHAVLPSPNLGIDMLYRKNDWRRLRALMVNELKYETIHSFVNQNTILEKLNRKQEHYPVWKKEIFNEGYIEYDRNEIEKAITFKITEDKTYLYLNDVYNDERFIEENIKELTGRGDIKLAKPFSDKRWKNELYVTGSKLSQNAAAGYESAIKEQVKICSQIFNKTCSIVSGSAGTGKTTVIKAIIKAIEFTSGNTESICLLAPTGKAADRIRQKTKKEALTIHAFLTKNGWLNFSNWTLKHCGGKRCDEYTAYIIDESSMIDLHLMAGLFRAIDWDVVRRIIFVGDPSQLPPIGRGKVFAEIIEYIKKVYPDNYGELNINVRQMENKISGKGTGILDLAALYVGKENKRQKMEKLLKQIQESDDDVTPDLRIITWNDADELMQKLTATIRKDLTEDGADNMMNHQIISPYRSEPFGTDNINAVIQSFRNDSLQATGNLAGITGGDKIIQLTNRANSNAYWFYDSSKKCKSRIDVYNGELGLVKWFDRYKKKFKVCFERKDTCLIEFSNESQVENNIELGYAISVHKAQGSEFSRLYFILPKSKQTLLSTELLYTGITRAQKHLTVFVENDFTALLAMTRPEKSRLALINSSVFDFKPLPEEMLLGRWYEEGKIHSTLIPYLVRSKSEVIIANMLFENGIENVKYEEALFAPDGTFYLPDFTVQWKGKTYYWEHLGMLDIPKYRQHWEEKQKWYEKNFAGQLITTEESTNLSIEVKKLIGKLKRNEL